MATEFVSSLVVEPVEVLEDVVLVVPEQVEAVVEDQLLFSILEFLLGHH